MKNLMLALSLLVSLNAAAASRALTKKERDHMTIKSVKVVDVTDSFDDSRNITLDSLKQKTEKKQKVFAATGAVSSFGVQAALVTEGLKEVNNGLDQADLIVDKVTNIGAKIWNIVAKGKPVANFQSNMANALPQNATDWLNLENWKDPQTRVMKVSYINYFGVEVVNFTYRVTLVAGGSAHGVGNYIGYVSVEPVQMQASYLYTFDSSAKVDYVFNKGTSANPVGAMVMTISWKASTLVSSAYGSHKLYLDGNGGIRVEAGQ